MREPRVEHRLAVILGQRPRVTGDQPGDQTGGITRQQPPRRVTHTRSGGLAGGREPAGILDRRRLVEVELGDRVLGGEPVAVAALGQRRRGPVGVPHRAQRQRLVEDHRAPFPGGQPTDALDGDQVLEAPRDRSGFGGDGEAHRLPPVLGGHRREQALLGGGHAHGRAGRDHGDHGQQREPASTGAGGHQRVAGATRPAGAGRDQPEQGEREAHPDTSHRGGRDAKRRRGVRSEAPTEQRRHASQCQRPEHRARGRAIH